MNKFSIPPRFCKLELLSPLSGIWIFRLLQILKKCLICFAAEREQLQYPWSYGQSLLRHDLTSQHISLYSTHHRLKFTLSFFLPPCNPNYHLKIIFKTLFMAFSRPWLIFLTAFLTWKENRDRIVCIRAEIRLVNVIIFDFSYEIPFHHRPGQIEGISFKFRTIL